ncbi:phage antirepressor KilAC domain-containing protein [Glycomyces sp. YM15]|uniref:phage antirepressor KilAC domain-containing protein n=1 Tax=Glycomyces sp. YM15 TaxID=2800446 RepID=UPI001966AC7D|nr:phage antirepressor KilAC domain-containing protein [Glycomyces sp. YM15]
MLPEPIDANTSPFDQIRRTDEYGEYWSGRDLMPLLDYQRWEDFKKITERAKKAARNSGHDAEAAFAGITEDVTTSGNTPNRVRGNFRLTRYAAYLVAMNGDPNKPEVAAAQTYFAVKTREAEVGAPPRAALTPREIAELVIREADRADAAEAQVAVLEPDAAAWRVLASATGDYSVEDAAKLLSRDSRVTIGKIRLFQFLNTEGLIYRHKGDGCWHVYQSAIDTGRLAERAQSHWNPKTEEWQVDAPQVRVTVKGLQHLHQRLTTVVDVERAKATARS